MQIEPNASATGVGKTPGRLSVKTRAETRVDDSVSLSQAKAVNDALQQTPAVRPEAVGQATELASDGQYPGIQIIDAIAKLLALYSVSQDQQE